MSNHILSLKYPDPGKIHYFLDFMGRQPLPAKDYVVLIKDGPQEITWSVTGKGRRRMRFKKPLKLRYPNPQAP